MTKYHISEHEIYPVYRLDADQGRHTIDLTDEEHANFEDVYAKWAVWQDRLDDAYYPTPPK